MGQRRDFRFDTNQPVDLTILGGLSRDDTRMAARLVNLSGQGASLTTEFSVPVGSAVRIDVDDKILLGEVCHSRQSGPSTFVCGVHLEQALTSVADLATLMQKLMGESRGAGSGVEPLQAQTSLVETHAPKERRRLMALLGRL